MINLRLAKFYPDNYKCNVIKIAYFKLFQYNYVLISALMICSFGELSLFDL
jgi:hypothetical protein